MTRRTVLKAMGSAALLGTARIALAQDAANYPNRPVVVVVPIAPGGGTDIFARLMATEMAKRLGQPMVVENRPGAGNVIGIRNVVSAPPDGYRLLFTSNTVTIDQNVKKNPEFDVLRDLAPIANVVNGVYALVVHASVPANTLAEFVAWAKANPGKVNYGSTGPATTGHLVTEEFARITGTKLFHIPYAGVAPATTALMAGDIHMLWNDVLLSMPGLKAGKLKMLAVATPRRSTVVPEVPTVAESGYPGFEPAFKFGFFAPAGTPKPIIDKLNAHVLAALEAPAIKAAAAERGWQLAGTSPEGYARMLNDEIQFWGRIVRDAGIEKQ